MKNKIIGNCFSDETGRVNRNISSQMYFTSQRKLIELKRKRKQTIKQQEYKMKRLMIFALMMAFIAPLALGGCSSTQNSDSSSYGKSKSSYEKGRMGSSGGY
jgi:type VI protein secretion system component VasF